MPYNRKGAIARIHCLARDKGIDKDTLKSIAAGVLEKPTDAFSLANCTPTQLSTILDHLTRQGAVTAPVPVNDGASARQIWKVNQLAGQLGMDSNRLQGFIERQTSRRVPPRHLRFFEASKVIEGLKKLIENPSNLP